MCRTSVDSERRITICCSLGTSTTLRFYWRAPSSSAPASEPVDIKLAHGDIYIMSEKATGNDWQQRSQYRLVHGAGASLYIDVEGTATAAVAVSSNTKARGTKRKAEVRDATQSMLSFTRFAARA